MILGIGLGLFSGGLSAAQDQHVPSKAVEVIVQGKHYESIHDYNLEQIEGILTKALSSQDLREFSEDELCGMIKEVRKMQTAGSPPKETPESTQQQSGESPRDRRTDEENVRDRDVSQMQEMLKSYLKEHKDADPLLLDPDKVKNIIIGPQE